MTDMISREIKFRVWYKAESRYLSTPDGLFFEYPSSTGSGEYIGDFIKDTDVYDTEQYTGLKDQKGVDIWEGDLVENGNERGPVVFDDGRFYIDPIVTLRPSEHRYMGTFYWGTVVGNRHQNPELLA